VAGGGDTVDHGVAVAAAAVAEASAATEPAVAVAMAAAVAVVAGPGNARPASAVAVPGCGDVAAEGVPRAVAEAVGWGIVVGVPDVPVGLGAFGSGDVKVSPTLARASPIVPRSCERMG
jgi:hypothetical protein